MLIRYFILSVTITLFIGLISCEREDITTNSSARISFSKDTISFDTVFTTIGSATRQFMIYNKNNKPINISNIYFSGGTNSVFKINVNGFSGTNGNIKDVRIEANDSAHVFVQVFIDPNNVNSPVLIEDSLIFICNDNQYNINFRALGQDVHLLRDSVLKTQIWTNDKPYYILQNIQVDTAETLTIEAGTTIYFDRKSWLIVDGTIIVNGTKEKPVVFRGNRLDKANYAPPILYDKIPGQWGGIGARNPSKNNKFNYVYIRNAEFGLILGDPKIKEPVDAEITNCRFENFSACALYGNNAKVKAVNSIFANSGYVNFSISTGGEYEFYHCTFGNYLTLGNKGIVGVFLRNYIALTDTNNKKEIVYGDLKKAYFGNCIIFGDLEDQLAFDGSSQYQFDYMFDHCLIRGNTEKLDISNAKHYQKSKIVKDLTDVFAKIDKENYVCDWHLRLKSPARDIGNLEIANQYPSDYDGTIRNLGDEDLPDAGAFEYVSVSTAK